MKKNDFKKSIDNINPDAYLGNRLKAKITTINIPIKKDKQVILTIATFCLVFAIIFSADFTSQTEAPAEQQETSINTVLQNKTIDAFILLASAEKAESIEDVAINKTLELNGKYPYEVYLKARSTRGLSDEDKSKIIKELRDDFNAYCSEKNFDTGRAEICEKENMIMTQYAFNEFKLNLKDTENIKLINVKSSSKYGQMVHNTNEPIFSAPKRGNDLTVNREEFDFEKSSFYWAHTEEMEKAFNENVNIPFSTFNDTITFTVEYNDDSKAIGVIELVFDEIGHATVACKNYDYVLNAV